MYEFTGEHIVNNPGRMDCYSIATSVDLFQMISKYESYNNPLQLRTDSIGLKTCELLPSMKHMPHLASKAQ